MGISSSGPRALNPYAYCWNPREMFKLLEDIIDVNFILVWSNIPQEHPRLRVDIGDRYFEIGPLDKRAPVGSILSYVAKEYSMVKGTLMI